MSNAAGPWRATALARLALAGALMTGCSPTFKRLRAELAQGAPGAYVSGVPFVRQARDRCGPAALASIAAFHKVPLTREEAAREVFLPSIRGTLTVDMHGLVQRLGLWCHAGRGTPEEVRTWLDRGLPVVALVRLGALHGRRLHYLVVTGYHARRGYFIAHTGHLANRPIAFGDFGAGLTSAGGWLLVACPPERVDWPLSAAGHNDLGLLFERAGNLARARAEYARATEAEPCSPLYRFNLGNALARLGRQDEAERAYREAIGLEPAYADAHNNLANLLLTMGRRHEALKAARRAIAIDGPRAGYYQDTLGRVHLALGEHEAAVHAFRAALGDAGADAALAAEARLGLIQALAAAGQRSEAIAEKNRLLATTTDPAMHQKAHELTR